MGIQHALYGSISAGFVGDSVHRPTHGLSARDGDTLTTINGSSHGTYISLSFFLPVSVQLISLYLFLPFFPDPVSSLFVCLILFIKKHAYKSPKPR